MSQFIDNLNYYNDHRVVAAERSDTPFVVETADGVEHELPTKWVVCPTCNGAGTHVNPSIDAGGLSAEDFADDPDFADDYRGGGYDVPCYGCAGRTTVRALDTDRCPPDLLSLYLAAQRELAECRAIERAERACGA